MRTKIISLLLSGCLFIVFSLINPGSLYLNKVTDSGNKEFFCSESVSLYKNKVTDYLKRDRFYFNRESFYPELVSFSYQAASASAAIGSNLHQSSSGDKSPAIIAEGDVAIHYGLSEEGFEALLKRQEESIVQQMRAALGDDEQERHLRKK